MKLEPKYYIFSDILKYHLQNVGHFVQAAMCDVMSDVMEKLDKQIPYKSAIVFLRFLMCCMCITINITIFYTVIMIKVYY